MAIDQRYKKRSAAKFSREEIQGHLDAIAFRKGLDAENFVEEAILWIKSQERLQWYHRGRRWGEIDLLGMDFLISFRLPEIIPLQVKSSEFGREEHIAQYGSRIPCVVRYPLDTVKMMAGKILMASFPKLYEGYVSINETEPCSDRRYVEPFNPLPLGDISTGVLVNHLENTLTDELVQV